MWDNFPHTVWLWSHGDTLMPDALPSRLHRLPVPMPPPAPEPTADAAAMRQLRHQTKNALQRIIAWIGTTELRATPEGCTLADEIERRIRLSARISDALFGLTAAPEPMERRLAALAEATVSLLTEAEQTIRTEVSITGPCPAACEATVVQVAHEMLGNAIKHGMHMRLLGQITVRLHALADGAVTLEVCDDGWGPCGDGAGEGLPIMQALADRHGGTVALVRKNDWTVASLSLPAPHRRVGGGVVARPRFGEARKGP